MQESYWALHAGKYSNKIYDTVARIILSSSTPANIQNKIYTTKAEAIARSQVIIFPSQK